MAFFGLGSCSKYYAYIFTLVVFRFICDYLEGFNEKNYYDRPQKEDFIEFASIFSYHPLFRDFMYFFGGMIVGLFLYIIYKRTEGNQQNKMSIEQVASLKRTLLGLDEENSNFTILLICVEKDISRIYLISSS